MKDIILALITRALFASHGLVGIWRAQTEWERPELWLLLVPVGALIVEALFTIGIRGGEEYKWVSPCVILYLCSVVPSIWFLELHNFDLRSERHYCSDLYWGNSAQPGCKTTFVNIPDDDVDLLLSNQTLLRDACALQLEYSRALQNLSRFTTMAPTTAPPTKMESGTNKGDDTLNNVVGTIEGAKQIFDNLLGNINIFNETTWVLVLHQLLLFILIIGRWLLPTGEGISRDELSQLLLVFIGVGADILEFVTETVKEMAVRCDQVLIILIMAFWSWSTLQFCLVLTAAKSRKTRAVGIYSDDNASQSRSPVTVIDEEPEEKGKCRTFCTNMEVWGIMSTLILQDGPFLGMRLYIMVGRKVVHQMIVFFTCKNLLVVILQLYRLSIIATAKKDEDNEEEDLKVLQARKSLDTIKTVALAKSKFAKGLLKKKNEDSNSTLKEKKSPKVSPTPSNEVALPEA